mmetsp:Transcript_14120/g.19290  ORF Transcript_14120/g.19290 Transcript_14120/m.19290 type:complete len:249 (+) Transcript_14120:1538-2284(+)
MDRASPGGGGGMLAASSALLPLDFVAGAAENSLKGLPVMLVILPIMRRRVKEALMPAYTMLPCVSRPLRPARPDICWAMSSSNSPFISPQKTQVLKGMLTPKASESSDTTTASLPFEANFCTARRYDGNDTSLMKSPMPLRRPRMRACLRMDRFLPLLLRMSSLLLFSNPSKSSMSSTSLLSSVSVTAWPLLKVNLGCGWNSSTVKSALVSMSPAFWASSSSFSLPPLSFFFLSAADLLTAFSFLRSL